MNKGYKWPVLAVSLLAGIADSLTGLGLILLPAQILNLMGIEGEAYPLSLIRFIGAFVFATGSLYLIGYVLCRAKESWQTLRIVWVSTAWIRACVAVVTGFMILTGGLLNSWIPVPLTDGLLAILQCGWVFSNRFPFDE